MAPSGIFGLKALPSAPSSAITSFIATRVARTSSIPPTTGISTDTGCSALGQRQVARVWQRKVGELLVPPHVEQAQHDLARVDALGGALPKLILFLLAGQRAADRKRELRPIETNPVGMIKASRLRVRNLAGVREQGDRDTIEGDRGQIDALLQPRAVAGKLGLKPLVLAPHRLVRVHKDDAGHAVDDELVACLDFKRSVSDP